MSASPESLVAAVFSPQAEVAQAFQATLCGEGATKGQVNLNGMANVVVEIPPMDPASSFSAHVKNADFSVMLLRGVDLEMLESARALMRAFPASGHVGVHIAIARNPGEAEFKMSCPNCSQKLLIKDALAFRRTRCPRCGHPFSIPGQTDLIRSELLVGPGQNIGRAQLGDRESCLNVLRSAFQQTGGRRHEEKSKTMRLDTLIFDDGNG